MTYTPIIFPELKNSKWKEVNLGLNAEKTYKNVNIPNPLLEPEFCNQFVKRIAQEEGVDFTYGGHFEDRKHLWRGYYNDEIVTHLGIDYNVPSGTLVSVPEDCEVVHSWCDTSIHNGWGGRLIFKLSNPWKGALYLIYGHLEHLDLPKEGVKFKKGDIIGKTGVPSENGGWFPHLHVQCVNESFFNKHIDDLKLLDGYYLEKGEPHDLAPSPKFLVGYEK
jgi:murein DD-endopeptidase MepM/ murein hydrolase activator NlpD